MRPKKRSDRIMGRLRKKFDKHDKNNEKYKKIYKGHIKYRDKVAAGITDETTEKDLKKPNRKLKRMRAQMERIRKRDGRLAGRTEKQLERYEKVKKKGK